MTPSTSRGYILWFPLTEAVNADSRNDWPDFKLIEADLAAGVDLLAQLVALRDTDVTPHFKIATPASSPAVESPAEGAEHGPTPAPSATLDDLRDHMRRTFSDADRKALAAYFDTNDTDRTDPAQVAEAIAAVEGFRDVATTPAERPQTAPTAAPMLPAVTDEGPELISADIEAAGKRYASLGDVPRGWVSACGAKVRLNPASGGVASVRRFEILRGLCILAEAGFDNDDAARAVLAAILGDIVWQQVPVADAVAALDVEEAKRFARICDAVTASLAPFEFPDDGRTVIDPKVLEVAA